MSRNGLNPIRFEKYAHIDRRFKEQVEMRDAVLIDLIDYLELIHKRGYAEGYECAVIQLSEKIND